MMNKNNRVVTLAVILIFAAIGAYVVIGSRIHSEYVPNYQLEDFYIAPSRKMGINEYKPASVTDEDMVITYFNTFVVCLIEDMERAYGHLSEKGRKLYPNMLSFRILVSNLTDGFTELPRIDSYEMSKDKDTDRQIIKISDKNGHIYVFTIEAVMKYTVDFE